MQTQLQGRGGQRPTHTHTHTHTHALGCFITARISRVACRRLLWAERLFVWDQEANFHIRIIACM